jgi:hypothetical protein
MLHIEFTPSSNQAPMQFVAYVLKAWENAPTSSGLLYNFRNHFYWAAVEAIAKMESIRVMAQRRGWQPVQVAREIVEKRAAW